MSEKPKGIHTKLLQFQKDIKPIHKGKVNPFYESSYTDINDLLAVVKPILSGLEILLTQRLTYIASEGTIVPAIETALTDLDSGEQMKGTFPIMESKDVQKQGGAITYTRRYAIQSMLALQAEDDDGNSNVSKPRSKKNVGTFDDIDL